MTPAISLLDISLKNLKTFIYKDTCISMFTAALFMVGQDMETTSVSFDR